MTTTITVRPARPEEMRHLLSVTARAYKGDAWIEYMFGDAARDDSRRDAVYQAVGKLWRAEDPNEVKLTTEGLEGIAVWHAPNHWKTPVRRMVRVVPALLRAAGVAGFVRAIGVLSAIEKKHPKELHWYLDSLATDPPAQRRGIGGALMAPILEKCDREGLPAYLETQKLENVAYYRRHGFEVRDEIEVSKNGLRVWTMWREPLAERV
jgi:GNAT superfamily N-acetyltransferase